MYDLFSYFFAAVIVLSFILLLLTASFSFLASGLRDLKELKSPNKEASGDA